MLGWPAVHDAVPKLQDYLTRSAARLPDKVALVCGGRRVTYRELEDSSNALAHGLAARGVVRGDRIMIFADNTVETVVSFWAALKADGVAVLVNPLTKAERLAYLVADCRPTALVTDGHLEGVWKGVAHSPHLKALVMSGPFTGSLRAEIETLVAFDELAVNARRSPASRNLDIDLAAIIYTSGSTGDPKGVMLTHRNMLTAASSISSYLEMQEDDVILNVLPLAFDYGLYQMIMAFRQGARLVLERSFAFLAQVLKVASAEKITGLPGVPTVFAMLAEMKSLSQYDLSSIRFVTNTAAALAQKHIDFIRRAFPGARVYSMYGLTECKRCTYLPPSDIERKPGSVGIAIPNTEVWVVDEQGRRVAPGVIGQLVVRGDTVMKGYWEKPEATAKKLKPGLLPGERVLWTGDICKMDEEGYVYFVGRMDDIIKSRGEKVAPKEVESVLMSLPGIREAAVIGVTDALLGEAVKAFVVLESGVELGAKEIQHHCQSKLESFKVPKLIEFMAELPKTDTGKVKKTGLQ
jgi:amino acid adenylation domain-containing protein